ncbi:MAG: acyltransferase family protein [Mariniblastus sp.]
MSETEKPIELAADDPTSPPKQRLLSLDSYRGLVLLLLCIEGPVWAWWSPIEEAFPESGFWSTITHHAQHVTWIGCSAWDLIQPSFMFMVGVSMAYSMNKRQRVGDSWSKILLHVLYRSLVLILLGVFLRSAHEPQTYWTFEDVLSQIGLGYTFLFLLWNRPRKIQWLAVAAILLGYYSLFALSPIYETAGNPEGYLMAEGYLANWNLNANPAHFADVWFLNLFPRESPFEFHSSGYNTLNFIPSLAIMILGLIAGELLRSDRSESQKLAILISIGLGGLVFGYLLDFAGLCPLIKKTWTPTFTLFSGGWCFIILSVLYAVIDMGKIRGWNFPLVVIGMNSIALYVMLHFFPGWFDSTLKIHIGENYCQFLGVPFSRLVTNVCAGLAMWFICFWMYRRKIFLKI